MEKKEFPKDNGWKSGSRNISVFLGPWAPDINEELHHLSRSPDVIATRWSKGKRWREHITYLPHEAVAEVSKDKEPIGRGCAEFNWFESQLASDSNELRVKWFGCHLIWDSNDFGCQLIWDSTDLVVNWFEIQVIRHCNWSEIQVVWLSIDLRFKWFGCQSIWDSNELVVNWIWDSSDLDVKWCVIQMSWLSIDLRFKWFGCQMIWGSSDLVANWCVIQMILSNEAFLPSKTKLWSSKTKLFCETSFKNATLKLQNEAFLRDFLQNWSFEAQKTKLFCETSFKNEPLKLQNEAFLRDFLQKWSVEAQKRIFCTRLPSKMKCRRDTWPQNSNTF